MTDYILQFHNLGTTNKVRTDFNIESSSEELISQLILEGYHMYQFIPNEYTYNMDSSELDNIKIPHSKFKREKKTWLGLSNKTVFDFFIKPKNNFFYPYQYGNYIYYFTKKELSEDKFQVWLNKELPNRFDDYDDTFAGFNSESIKLINDEDFVIVSCHDGRDQLGITGNSSVVSKIIAKLKNLDVKEFELEHYNFKST